MEAVERFLRMWGVPEGLRDRMLEQVGKWGDWRGGVGSELFCVCVCVVSFLKLLLMEFCSLTHMIILSSLALFLSLSLSAFIFVPPTGKVVG